MYDAQILQILGVLYLLVGLGFMFNKDYYKKLFKDMVDNTSYMFWGGAMAYFLGAVLVSFHNILIRDWAVLVTIIGWLALLKGVFIILLPSVMNRFVRWIISRDYMSFMGVSVFILGIFVLYVGCYLI